MSNAFILIVGPTATGKSALALDLAESFHGSILNCDSLQAYQRLDIGSAKPTVTERARCPHFLFDCLSPPAEFTAGDFRKAALTVLAQEIPRRCVFGVGGSGFYIQALEKGMFKTPKPSPAEDHAEREELRQQGLPVMFEKLRRLDPESAEALHPNDEYRILRALIVHRVSGQKLSQLRAQFQGEGFPYPLLKLGLNCPPAELKIRVEARTRAMLKAGLRDEVSGLLNDGFGAWPALQSVGYRECVQVLRGELSLDQLEAQIVLKTMQLAKKQRTWFKRDPDIRWLDPSSALPQARQIVAHFLDSLD